MSYRKLIYAVIVLLLASLVSCERAMEPTGVYMYELTGNFSNLEVSGGYFRIPIPEQFRVVERRELTVKYMNNPDMGWRIMMPSYDWYETKSLVSIQYNENWLGMYYLVIIQYG